MTTEQQRAEDAWLELGTVKTWVSAKRAYWTPAAEALHTLKTTKAWKALGLGGWRDILADNEVTMPEREAAALIAAWEYFGRSQWAADDWEEAELELTITDPIRLASTVPAVKAGRITRREAVSAAQTLPLGELKVYVADPNAALDSTAEPPKCRCSECGSIHRPKGEQE